MARRELCQGTAALQRIQQGRGQVRGVHWALLLCVWLVRLNADHW